MLQRIQTVYLILSVIAVVAMQFLPLAEIKGSSENFVLTTVGIFNNEKEQIKSVFPVSLIMSIETVLTLVIIFLYKKRSRQMLLAKLNLLLLTALIAIVFFYADYAKTLQPNDSLVNYKFACMLPVIAIVLNYLAVRAIKKDDALVRAADRLR